MKSIHVKIDEKLLEEVEAILPFHGGVSHATRIALKNFVRDVRTGKITVSLSPPEGDKNEKGSPDRT